MLDIFLVFLIFQHIFAFKPIIFEHFHYTFAGRFINDMLSKKFEIAGEIVRLKSLFIMIKANRDMVFPERKLRRSKSVQSLHHRNSDQQTGLCPCEVHKANRRSQIIQEAHDESLAEMRIKLDEMQTTLGAIQTKQDEMQIKQDKMLTNQVTILNSLQELIGTLNHSNSKTQCTKENEFIHNFASSLTRIASHYLENQSRNDST